MEFFFSAYKYFNFKSTTNLECKLNNLHYIKSKKINQNVLNYNL